LRCHFLRSVGPDGRLADSQPTAVPTHRCAAFGDPLPLSLRQQELVCLQRVHVSCPRYVRGMVLANENAAPAVVHGGRPGISLKMAAAIVLVITAVAVLITGPVLGVLPLGGVGRGTSPVLVSPSPAVTATPPPFAEPDSLADRNALAESDSDSHANGNANPHPHADGGKLVASGMGRRAQISPGSVHRPAQLLVVHRPWAGSRAEWQRLRRDGRDSQYRDLLQGRRGRDLRLERLDEPPRHPAR
jgi:hypothetical protein